MTLFPEGDPAQHLVEEVLFRAAKKAGKIPYHFQTTLYLKNIFHFPVVGMNNSFLIIILVFITAGMDFHELLDIPQGDRRRYHDDVSVIIISFEGRIWRSSM